MREKPPTPAGEEDVDVQLRTRTAVKSYFKNGSAIVVFITIFFGMGIFNSVTTCLEQILRSRSFDSETIGIFGGLIFLVGIIGAVVLGAISDKVGKRKPFIIAGSVMMIPSLLGLGFAADPTIVLVSCILFGFFMLGLGPLTFQYAAEITKPAPETISQSVLQLSGQLAGLIFVLAMGSLGDYMYTILLVFAAISVVNLVLQSRLKDSRFLINNAQAKHPEKQPTN
jgi:Cyanate permease